MELNLVELLPQLGIAAVVLWLLLQEQKRREDSEKRYQEHIEELENRLFGLLESDLEASRPKRPEGG